MLSPANTKGKRKKTKKPCLSHHPKTWVTKDQSPGTLGSYKVVTLLLRDCPMFMLHSALVPGITRATSRPLRYLNSSQTDSKLSAQAHDGAHHKAQMGSFSHPGSVPAYAPTP